MGAFQLAKHCRHSFQPKDDKRTLPFSVICSDAWVSTLEKTRFVYKYLATFTDECSRMTDVYLMKNNTKTLICSKFFTIMSNVYVTPKFKSYALEVNILQRGCIPICVRK